MLPHFEIKTTFNTTSKIAQMVTYLNKNWLKKGFHIFVISFSLDKILLYQQRE